MLGAGSHTLRLDAADVSGSHFAGEIRIFGEVFKIAAAEGAALDVQTGAKEDIYIIGRSFLSDEFKEMDLLGGNPEDYTDPENYRTLEQIVNLINLGGFTCGIGEWRPEKDGSFGTYQVVAVE